MAERQNQQRAHREIAAGAVVFRRVPKRRGRGKGPEIQFLLLYHGNGYWNFPKGKIDPGERSFQTFLREVEEETGITRRDMRIIPGFRATDKFFFFRDQKPVFKIVIFYLVETEKRAIRISEEHDGYGWFTVHDAIAISKFKNSKVLIQKAYAFIKSQRVSGGHGNKKERRPTHH